MKMRRSIFWLPLYCCAHQLLGAAFDVSRTSLHHDMAVSFLFLSSFGRDIRLRKYTPTLDQPITSIYGGRTNENDVTRFSSEESDLTSEEFSLLFDQSGENSQKPDLSLKPIVKIFTDDLKLSKIEISKLVKSHPSLFRSKVYYENLRQLVAFFLEFDLTNEQIGKILMSCPTLLLYKVEGNIKPTINVVIKTLKLSKKDAAKLITKCPEFPMYSVEKNLKFKLRYAVLHLGLTRKEIGKIVISSPMLITMSLDKNIIPTVHFFQDLYGLTEQGVGKLLKRDNGLLFQSIEKGVKPKIKYLEEELGLSRDELILLGTQNPSIFKYNVEKNIKPKIKYFEEKFGLSREKTLQYIVSYPLLLAMSIKENLEPNLALLVDYGIPRLEAIDHIMSIYISYKKRLSFVEYAQTEFQATRSEIKEMLTTNMFKYSLEGRVKVRVALMEKLGIPKIAEDLKFICTMVDKEFAKWISDRTPNLESSDVLRLFQEMKQKLTSEPNS